MINVYCFYRGFFSFLLSSNSGFVFYPRYTKDIEHSIYRSHRHCGLFMSHNTKLMATLLLFLCTVVLQMGISCCALLMLCRNNIGDCRFYYYSLSSFSAFSFCVFVALSLFLFLGASIVSVNNLKRAAYLVL